MVKPDLVVVTWTDIASRADWMDQEEAEKCLPETCLTVGWIVAENEDTIVLADSATASGEWGGTTVIPKAVIQKKKKIPAMRPESFLTPSRRSRPAKSRAKHANRQVSGD